MQERSGLAERDSNDRSFLFVVTCGRSGSTLVQGVLNSIPGFCICGENMNACLDLMGFYKSWYSSIDSFRSNNMPVDSRNSWFQVSSVPELKAACQDFLWRLCAKDFDDRVVGFKEIRWRSVVDLEGFLDWLFVVFNARFLFLTRNHAEICRSKWFRESVGCDKMLQDWEDRVGSYIACHPYQDWFWLDLGCLHPRDSVSPEIFRDLFGWLGEEFDRKVLQGVLDRNWGY